MSEKATPTPRPWIIFSDRGNAIAIMPAGRPGDICKMTTARLQAEVNANAELIVTAVNNYDALVAALEHAVEWMELDGCDCGSFEDGTCGLCKARAALAAIKERK